MAKRSAQTSGGASPAERVSYTTRPLDASTWDAFAELVERNNGVYGGCWCIAHHSEYQRGVSDPRTLKEELVRAGRAHAALVFDEDDLARQHEGGGCGEALGHGVEVRGRGGRPGRGILCQRRASGREKKTGEGVEPAQLNRR